MEEELGDDFIKNCDFSNINIFEEAQLKFPENAQGSRELKTDDGQEMKMKGKRYLFIKIQANTSKLDIKKTEFDDYQWLNTKEAINIANKIYQVGKKQITLKAINSLNSK